MTIKTCMYVCLCAYYVCRKIVSKPIEHLKTKMGNSDGVSSNSTVHFV